MISQSQLARITAAPPTGQKKTVQVRVDLDGDDGYSFAFKSDICTPDGVLVCLGPPGHAIAANRYVLTFVAVKGNYVTDVSFVDPADPAHFEFVAGVIQDPGDPCCITPDPNEFEAPVKGPRESIVLVDRKANSDRMLGYRFAVWVTDYQGGVTRVQHDPRIINR